MRRYKWSIFITRWLFWKGKPPRSSCSIWSDCLYSRLGPLCPSSLFFMYCDFVISRFLYFPFLKCLCFTSWGCSLLVHLWFIKLMCHENWYRKNINLYLNPHGAGYFISGWLELCIDISVGVDTLDFVPWHLSFWEAVYGYFIEKRVMLRRATSSRMCSEYASQGGSISIVWWVHMSDSC